MKKICVAILSFTLMTGELSAQLKTEPTVVASAEGATKDEATKMALRSVIEQAFGVYVASNTSLLNDEVVQNEVATISNGNIKEYKVLSSDFINGRYYVTLQATVSLKKLFDYSKEQAVKKGMTVRINGEILNNDFQLARLNYELNKKAERLAINNMIKQLEELTKSVPLLDYEMELTEPRKITYTPTFSGSQYYIDIAGYDGRLALGKPYLSGAELLKELKKYENYWGISGKLTPKFNDNTVRFFDIFISTMEAVAVGQGECQEAKKYNFDLYYTPCHFGGGYENKGFSYVLRNPVEIYKYVLYGLDLLFVQRVNISDDKSNFTSALVVPRIRWDDPYKGSQYVNYVFPYGYKNAPTFGLYLGRPDVLYIGERITKRNKIKFSYKIGDRIAIGDGSNYAPQDEFRICIPQDEIGNYNSFSINYKYPTQNELDMYNSICGKLYSIGISGHEYDYYDEIVRRKFLKL